MELKGIWKTIASFVFGLVGMLIFAVISVVVKELVRSIVVAAPVCPRHVPNPLWIDLIPIILPILALIILFKFWQQNPFSWKAASVGVFIGILAIGVFSVIISISGMSYLPSDPTIRFENYLRNIQLEGYGATQPQKMCFKEGIVIYTKDLIRYFPIEETDLQFTCQNDPICGANGKLIVTPTRIQALSEAFPFVVTCGNENRLVSPKYCIAIASTGEDATRNCKKLCEIQ